MDKAKKKQNKKILSWICIAALVLTLTAMPLMARSEVEENGPVASILSGTVEKGSVSTTLHGGGSLSLDNAEDVKLPSGVKITAFLVGNGDVVTKGTPLAAVDDVSVMTAIVEVKETLEYLQEQIESVRNETVSKTIPATAGGRIKEVYAQPGDSVQDVMLRHGALAVLSLDSLMAVKLEGSLAIATGDAVTVTLSDGREITGRVESNLDGVIVVTVEDKGYPIGEKVIVTTEVGNEVGAGELYVHNAWKAVAFTGTINTVSAKQEREVTAGATLFTLKDTEFTGELENLSNQHREYEALMQDLFRMYESGTIDAPCDGVVSGVEKDSAFLLSGGAVDWTPVPLTATEEKGWTILLLSAEAPAAPENGSEENTGTEEGGEAAASYIGYAGLVTQVGTDALIATMSELGGTVTKTAEGGWDLSQVSLDTQNMIHTNMTFAVADPAAYGVGDIVVVIYDESGNYTVEVAVKAAPEPSVPEEPLPSDPTDPTIPGQGQLPGGIGSMGGMDLSGLLGGMMGGMSGMTGGTAQEEEQELFELEGETLLTVTPQNTVRLTITLDEQDISRVSPGQTALVKVEALRGQSFEAEVTAVSTSGANNGGSSKFTVTLEMPYGYNMLQGMSATAQLPLQTKLDVLTIPVKALAQDGAKTVVYTALDEETGELSSPVEVTIGLSDGITAEVVSGLEMGDTYYYSYYDILELDTKAEAGNGFSFGG